MDNVTHALAGLLLAEATVALTERRTHRAASPGFARAAAVVGVLAAELPDADLVYAGPVLGMGNLGYLLHHRGHTHTVVFAVLAALLLWGATLAVRRGGSRTRSRTGSRGGSHTDARMERWPLLALALVGTLSHLALDFTNNYGVHPFWPLANDWHYGDAVFIVEPWLWVAALPPLLLGARGMVGRALLAIALVAIVGAAWTVGQVERGAALAVTIGAAAWLAIVVATARGRAPMRRVALGLAAWLAVEGVFFAASSVARARVATAVRTRAADGPLGNPSPASSRLLAVALTPAVGNPLCFRALVMELDGPTYRVTAATVAPVPALRDASRCAPPPIGAGLDLAPSTRPATPAVRWGGAWSAPRAELAALAATNCEVAAALRFVRVPLWRRAPDGTVVLVDLRFASGAGGFATVVADARPTACPAHVPPWTPPRQDLLGAP